MPGGRIRTLDICFRMYLIMGREKILQKEFASYWHWIMDRNDGVLYPRDLSEAVTTEARVSVLPHLWDKTPFILLDSTSRVSAP